MTPISNQPRLEDPSRPACTSRESHDPSPIPVEITPPNIAQAKSERQCRGRYTGGGGGGHEQCPHCLHPPRQMLLGTPKNSSLRPLELLPLDIPDTPGGQMRQSAYFPYSLQPWCVIQYGQSVSFVTQMCVLGSHLIPQAPRGKKVHSPVSSGAGSRQHRSGMRILHSGAHWGQ